MNTSNSSSSLLPQFTKTLLETLLHYGITLIDAQDIIEILLEFNPTKFFHNNTSMKHFIHSSKMYGIIRRRVVYLALQDLQRFVILFCGIPGAGKSILTQALHRKLFSNHYKKHSHIIEFDALLPNQQEWTSETFHESRKAGLQAIRDSLNQIHNKYIIIDDNMMYKSMRKQVKRICEEWVHLHFGTTLTILLVYVHIDLQIALDRNRTRLNTVISESTIQKMYKEFDIPTISSSCIWVNSIQNTIEENVEAIILKLNHEQVVDGDKGQIHLFATHDYYFKRSSSTTSSSSSDNKPSKTEKELETIMKKRQRGEQIRNALKQKS
jgi:tRNA uridine 5-carbamoylmethylation protein Kti12